MCKKFADRIKILVISLLLVVLPVQTVWVSAAEPLTAAESIGTKPSLNRKKLILEKGQSFRLKITGTTARSWKSSKPAVAAVGSKGLVKAKKPGTTVISCRAANGKTYRCTVTVRKAAPSEEQVYKALIAMKAKYPEGMHWTNANWYVWYDYDGYDTFTGMGCVAFAMIMSDAAFGKDAPARPVKDLSPIRVGDILRIDNGRHTVIVLEVKENSVIVAEGNYNSSIHWGREISLNEIKSTFVERITRYPD